MAKKKKLIVIPLAGLGNRMRTLASSVQIAKRDNRELCVVWPVNADLGCDITDIFESIGMPYTRPSRFVNFLLSNLYRLTLISKFFGLYKLFSKLFADYSVFDDDIYGAKNKLEISNEYDTILVASCLSFSTQDYSLFRFNVNLRNEVARETAKIGQEYIGIHIRRTDHKDTIQHSPDENYLKHIDHCILANPQQKFFLATDDLPTKAFFTSHYEGRIFTLDSKMGRGNLEGINAAIVEMLMLSQSTKLLCSAISSFSTAAILLGNIRDVVFVDTFVEKDYVLADGEFPSEFQNL
ncbi:hypothetical protein [Dyadobacter luticola]|uniref:Glycosyl transferase n=1 Tax=Dyadobacter luticola TaxID=1979387 RepID=A0A5R9L5N0_9BACT|nr:hypothetical protein [Dyadobacter luticola]TLV03711.1 hypothetical protein FEN17_08965 [Dyadobacter luticola]